MALNRENGIAKPSRASLGKTRAPSAVTAKAGSDARSPLTVTRGELLVDGSDHLYRQLVHELLTFAAMHEAIRDGIAAYVELGGVQHTILQSIRHLGASQSVAVRDVAHHLGLSGSFITIETAKLQERGLLEKRQSTTDRRKVSLVLTKKSNELFNKVAPLQQSIGDVQFGCLSAKQFRNLVPLVTRLVETSREALLLLPHLKGPGATQGKLARKARGRKTTHAQNKKPARG